MVLVEQQDERQEGLGFRTIGYESNHGAVLSPLRQGAALFFIQEQLSVGERLDFHNLASSALPQPDHGFIHIHIYYSLCVTLLRLHEIRPLPRRQDLEKIKQYHRTLTSNTQKMLL